MLETQIFPFPIIIEMKTTLYTTLNSFSIIVNNHGPLKKKVDRRNHAPSVTKEFRKAIYTRSKLRNNFWKYPTKKMNLRTRNKGINAYQLGENA